MTYMYAVYYGDQWMRTLSRKRAEKLARLEHGLVMRRPYVSGAFDAPTFAMGADVIADWQYVSE